MPSTINGNKRGAAFQQNSSENFPIEFFGLKFYKKVSDLILKFYFFDWPPKDFVKQKLAFFSLKLLPFSPCSLKLISWNFSLLSSRQSWLVENFPSSLLSPLLFFSLFSSPALSFPPRCAVCLAFKRAYQFWLRWAAQSLFLFAVGWRWVDKTFSKGRSFKKNKKTFFRLKIRTFSSVEIMAENSNDFALASTQNGSTGSGPPAKSFRSSNKFPNGKKTKGRVKIKMEFIDNKLRRYTTFSKRKTGIMKKVKGLQDDQNLSQWYSLNFWRGKGGGGEEWG